MKGASRSVGDPVERGNGRTTGCVPITPNHVTPLDARLDASVAAPHPSALALMERHVEALYTHDAGGRILRVREHDGAPAPRFFLGRTVDGAVRRYRHDVDDVLRRELEAASADHEFPDDTDDPGAAAAAELARYAAILARSASVERTEAGPAFAFPAELPAPYDARGDAVVRVTEANVALLRPLLPAWVPDVHRSPPLMALVVDGRAAAVCGSVRITPRAHEAGVETAPPYRGRGYAPRVAAQWARAVRTLGIEPLYSTSWQNAASRVVARKLGFVTFGSDLHLT